jgi:hypothetical protein
MLKKGMAKATKRGIPTAEYKKVTIRLYKHRDRFKATFQIPGQKRYEFYGKTQAAAQQAAQTAIDNHRDPDAFAAGRDEDRAHEILDKHGITLTQAAKHWENHHSTPQSTITVEAVREQWLREGSLLVGQMHSPCASPSTATTAMTSSPKKSDCAATTAHIRDKPILHPITERGKGVRHRPAAGMSTSCHTPSASNDNRYTGMQIANQLTRVDPSSGRDKYQCR